jgi:error-prone DNA polymerase
MWAYNIRELGVRVAARGSGADSMVNHALHIVATNPLQHRLVFERFLSVRRVLPGVENADEGGVRDADGL